jgi:hypothetical protein
MPGLVMAALLLTYALPVSGLVGLPGSLPRLMSGSVSKIKARPLSRSSSRRPCLSCRRSRGHPGSVGPCQSQAVPVSGAQSFEQVFDLARSNKFLKHLFEWLFRPVWQKFQPNPDRILTESQTESQPNLDRILESLSLTVQPNPNRMFGSVQILFC